MDQVAKEKESENLKTRLSLYFTFQIVRIFCSTCSTIRRSVRYLEKARIGTYILKIIFVDQYMLYETDDEKSNC